MTADRPGLRGNPWAALTVLSLGLFMTLLDVTIVNIAIPQLLDSLQASLDEALWVVNAYVLMLGVLLITAGRLGDLFGPRNVYVVGTALFTVASAACGLAQSPQQLIAARAVQGVGAALLTPQSLTIVLSLFPPERRGAAFAVNGITAGVASLAGPTLGGLIVTHWDWRGIFFVNLPVGVLAIALTLWLVPDLRPGRRHRLDVTGVLLATGALSLISFGLIEGQRYEWGQVWSFVSIPLLLAAGVVALALFALQQRGRQTGDREPLVPFALFRDRNYTLGNVIAGAMQLGMVGMFLPTTIYMQSVLGYDALTAGLFSAPLSLVAMVLAPFVGRAVDRVGGKWILLFGLTAFAAGMALYVLLAGVDSTGWTFVPAFVVAGVGMACIFTPLFAIAMANVPVQLGGAASGLLNTTRQVGSVIGGAAVGALLQQQLAGDLREQAAARAHELPERLRGPFVDGFRAAGSQGLEVGAGQTGGGLRLPADAPVDVARTVARVAADVFHHGFTAAMRSSLLLPIAVLTLAALACLAIRQARPGGPAPAAAAREGAEPAAATRAP